MFAKLTMQCYHKRDRRGILEHAMHSIHLAVHSIYLAARIPEECFNKTAGDKTNGIMGYIR